MGIDGYSFLEHLPIQVKQSDKVGRNVVDNFETAIKRERKTKGYVIAFSFTRNAHEEVARVKRDDGMEIVLVRVSSLLEDPANVVAPESETEQLFHDLVPKPRSREARPSVEELIESDKRPMVRARRGAVSQAE
jgi:arginine utilization protein RocB